MGVTISKYLGYVVDIQQEWDNLLDEQQDLWSLSRENDTDIFKPYYVAGNPEGRITVVNDGMNGQYTKLVYVVAYCKDMSDDDEEIVKKVNEYLKYNNIPFDVRQKLNKIYKEMFGPDSLHYLDIQMQYFIHWS